MRNICLLVVKFSKPESERLFLLSGETVDDVVGFTISKLVFISKYVWISSKLVLLFI